MYKINIILCIFIASCCMAKADDVISKDVERRFNLEVFRMLGEYESCSTMSTRDQSRRFVQLFETENIEIYNDLIGLSDKPKLSVSEYVQLFQQQDVVARKVAIREVQKERVIDGGSVWLMDVTFDKAVSYFHQKVWLDAEEYYGEPYHIRVRFAYPKNEESSRGCKIVALDGSLYSETPRLPTDYMVIERATEKIDREESVVYQGEALKFNRSGQMLLPPNAKLSYYDSDVKMQLEKDTVSDRLYRLSFRSRHFRFKPRIEFSLGRNYALKGKSIDYLKTQSKDFTMGFDFGYTFPTKSKMRIGIFTGVALSNSEVSLSIDDLNYYYYAGSNLDVDGDSYKRYYEVSNMKQTINLKMLMIPLYFDFDFLMSKSISTYLDVGVKAYSNLSNKVSTQLDVYKYGIYPIYQNLFIDENWLNRFGNEKLDNSSQQYDFVEVVKTVDAFVGAGIRTRLYRQLYFDLGLHYQLTVYRTPIEMPYEKVSLMPNETVTQFPLVEYRQNGSERVHNIVSHFDGIKRNALKLNVGLLIKF